MAGCTESGDATPNRLVIAQLNKTRMCIKFTKGACRDSECCFAHSEEELRRQPDLSKTAICRAFQRGMCSDAECKYAHGEDELRVNPNVYKTQLCNFFQRGHCKKGASCRHAHGRKELRGLQEQIPPMPGRKESLATPKRGAKLTQAPDSPGVTRPALGDLSNRNGTPPERSFHTPPSGLADQPHSKSALLEHFETPEKMQGPSNRKRSVLEQFQTPQKTSVMDPLQEHFLGYGGSGIPAVPTTWEPMKVPFPDVTAMSPSTPSPIPGLGELLQCPELPVPLPWGSPGSPGFPLTDSFAKAAAAAAMSAHQHTIAAKAAESAARNFALMHSLMPASSLAAMEATLEKTEPTTCEKAGEDRRWVL
eukprot:TRINITY_DN7001_c0_g1_i1.p1 TRINITY_DN7001_c0_g1~~TRINITY_DN7001_c0_g1_i1.p1  ORF type:complete len:364 (-),score=54.31 TRINITY_DN7001_c0_g1_i1:278-1369(-)